MNMLFGIILLLSRYLLLGKKTKGMAFIGNQLRLSNAKALIGYNVREVGRNEFESVVCLVRYIPLASWQETVFCSGTLISNSHVLTSEHCYQIVAPDTFQIVTKSENMENGVRFNPIWWIGYDQWMRTRGRRISTPLNDIFIIKIIGLTDHVVSSQIAYVKPNSQLFGLDVDIIGCGIINGNVLLPRLHAATVKVKDIKACRNLVSSLEGKLIALVDNFLCTVGNPYTFLENGDSGGPIIYEGKLVGVSMAVCPAMGGEFHPSKVNIHVSVNNFQEFIDYFLNDLN